MNNLPYDQQFPLYVEGTTQCALFAKKVIIDQMEATLKLRKPSNKEFFLHINYHRLHALLYTMQFLGTDVIHCQTLTQCTRSIFELGLDIEYVEKVGNMDDYDKFVAYATVVDRYQRATKYVKANPGAMNDFHCQPSSSFINDKSNKKEYDNLSKKYYYNSNKKRVIIPKHWSGLPISERAKKAGKPYSDMYQSYYSYFSDFTHSSGTIFINIPVAFYTVFSVQSHHLAQDIFERITRIVAKSFNIDKTFTDFDLTLKKVSGYTQLKMMELEKSL